VKLERGRKLEQGQRLGGVRRGAYGKEELEFDSYLKQKEPCIKAFSAGHTLEEEVRPACSIRIVESSDSVVMDYEGRRGPFIRLSKKWVI
jgi:hypothetical protein